jgi:hypothetical protein
VNADTIATIFTLLVGLSLFGVVLARFSGDQVRSELVANGLTLAAVVAVGATLGSLYFSEIENFVPCELCWFQRITMYPLAVILPIAAVRGDHGVVRYAAPLALIGGAISIYHYQLQLFPSQGSSCSLDIPCTFQWIDVFGFVSIPLLALGCFTLIVLLLFPPKPSTASEMRTNE